MLLRNFEGWKETQHTKALMRFVEDLINNEKLSIPSWEDVEHPEKLAYKIGLINAWNMILNITKEDLKEDDVQQKRQA